VSDPRGADTGSPPDPERTRGSLGLLIDPTFGPFFFGKLLSTVGVWVHNIAAAIVVFQLTGSAAMVGAVSIAQFAPQLVLTPWSGAQADRGDRRRQLIMGRLITAGGSGGLVLVMQAGELTGTRGALTVIAAAGVVGIGFAIGGPAMHALVPSLVPRAELPVAIAMNSVPFTLARAAGPALGALLVAGVGPAVAFGLAAAGNAGFAIALTLIDIRQREALPARDPSVRGGLRHVRMDPALILLLLGAAAVGIGTDPVITLTPSIAAELGGGERLVGALASAFGVGAGVAFVTLTAIRNRVGLPRLGVGGLLQLAVGFGALALSTSAPAAIVALVVAGAGMTFALTSLTTQVQQRVPDDVRGRVMALWSIAFLGTRPLAAAINGTVADATSVSVALTLVAAMLLAAAWATLPSRVLRRAG
jgi:MFS family permease